MTFQALHCRKYSNDCSLKIVCRKDIYLLLLTIILAPIVTDGVPTVTGSVVLDNDLAVTVSLDGHSVSQSHYDDIFKGSVDSLSQLMAELCALTSQCTQRRRENLDDDHHRVDCFIVEPASTVGAIRHSSPSCFT